MVITQAYFNVSSSKWYNIVKKLFRNINDSLNITQNAKFLDVKVNVNVNV